MERKRVFEIKKRFEDLDKNKSLTNGNTSTSKLSSLNTNKILPKTCRNEVLQRQSESAEKHIIFKRTCSGTSSLDGQSGKNVIKRSPAFRSSKNDFSGGSKVKIGSSQSKKDALESPLPDGPAPRKPPRTFAHRVVGDLPDVPPKQPCVPPQVSKPEIPIDSNKKANFKRSKTEPLIMLKKIESALMLHQATKNGGVQESPPPPPTTNRNVYEVPHVSRRAGASLSPQVSPVRSSNEPVYSEPCIVKSKSRSPPGPQSSKSLYYMSSPIVDRDGNPRLPRNPTYEEALKKIQMWVLEPSAPPAEVDSDVESVKEIKQEVVEERKIYAKRVSSLRERSAAFTEVRTQRVMDALLLVGIDSVENTGKVAYIKSKYPYNAEIPDNIACLIFPDAANWPPAIHPPVHVGSHNNYTITLTSAERIRSYAYCRRLQPEGSTVCLPLAYAILTSHKANSFYYHILEEIENNHGLAEQKFKEFVRDLYNTDFPNECQSTRVGEMTLKRGMDPRQEGNEISKLLKAVGVPNFLQLLSNVLMEKKIILVSSYISLLSDSIEGLLKAVYPFEWQHTISTVLPSTMLEFLESITPYVFGIMKNDSSPITSSFFQKLDHVFVIDVDKGQIIANTDKTPVIPDKLAKSLSMALYLTPVNGTDIGPSEALMRLFVQLVGHYRNHLESRCDSYPNHMRVFQRENFIKAPSSKTVRQFLEWFTETTMFLAFIEEKKDHRTSQGSLLFDQRCAEYIEENANKKSTTLNKAVKNIGDRIKDWRS